MKKEFPSKFNKIIRIKEKKLNWLKQNKPKDIKSIAKFLDIIINEYKKNVR